MDDDFTQPPQVDEVNRLVSRFVQIGVDPDSLIPQVLQDFRTQYGLLPADWILRAVTVKKFRQEPVAGVFKVWYRVRGEPVVVEEEPSA